MKETKVISLYRKLLSNNIFYIFAPHSYDKINKEREGSSYLFMFQEKTALLAE